MKNITIIEKYPEINYAIVKRDTTFQSFIACWYLNDDNPEDVYWSQGHYFDTLIEAVDYIKEKLAEEEEDDVEELDPWGWSYNMPCDTYGVCVGTSCRQFFECHGGK